VDETGVPPEWEVEAISAELGTKPNTLSVGRVPTIRRYEGGGRGSAKEQENPVSNTVVVRNAMPMSLLFLPVFPTRFFGRFNEDVLR
jgi:hypothetical protein